MAKHPQQRIELVEANLIRSLKRLLSLFDLEILGYTVEIIQFLTTDRKIAFIFRVTRDWLKLASTCMLLNDEGLLVLLHQLKWSTLRRIREPTRKSLQALSEMGGLQIKDFLSKCDRGPFNQICERWYANSLIYWEIKYWCDQCILPIMRIHNFSHIIVCLLNLRRRLKVRDCGS